MATIKAIEARTIHQIQSGQVIVDLCSVVKELVENSLDAGATNIEVRFKNQGLDSIEVQDNGSGISKQNYETLALKHYTSKLSTYADLTSLQTYGFRGEALSSLCALSKFTVTTCVASDVPKGSKLEFETSGKLRGTSIVATQKGTTVSVEGLFHNLPVRRRELERNIKREWNRVIGVLNQYACIKTGVKFSVSQQPNKGKRMVLFSTKGNQTTRENIINVFGAKTLAVLIPLDLELELEPTNKPARRWMTAQHDDSTKEIHVRGHVSRPAHGEGRQTPDRQMFFVNGRPCGLPQFAKVFNEVYKSYNASQSPFIFADIQLDTHLYDVNVSPDKRTILLQDQSRMLDNLRESLIALFESQDYALPVSQLSGTKQTPFKKLSLNRQSASLPESEAKRSVSIENESRAGSISTNLEREKPHEAEKDDESQEEPGQTRSSSMKPSAFEDERPNLISKWIERKSDLRAETSPARTETSEDRKDSASDTENHIPESASKDVEVDEDEMSEHATHESPTPPTDLTETPDRVAEFRERLAELSKSKSERHTHVHTSAQHEGPDPPIPVVSTSSRAPDIRTNRITSSAPLKRPAPEVATITIGNHTVTSIIGTPPKKQRIEDHQAHKAQTSLRQERQTVSVPSFSGRLTQMFAATSQPRQAKPTKIEVTSEMRDVSDYDSESSGERLFVEDDEDEDPSQVEEQNEGQSEADAQSVIVEQNQGHDRLSPESEEDDSQLQNEAPPSPTQESDKEYRDERGEEEQETIKREDTVGSSEAPRNLSEETQKRTQSFVKGGTKKKDATYPLLQLLRIDEGHIRDTLTVHQGHATDVSLTTDSMPATNRLDAEDAEEKLSLTISKSDFEKMRIIGQFNLGFIIAVRAAEPDAENGGEGRAAGNDDDELFIIDQHATDEKYNFERLQASTVVQSQRLVQPKPLELTALEEEIIKENIDALETNGFAVSVDESGDRPVGSRCQLLSLPLSRETTFSLADLEELIALLAEHHHQSASAVPRPSRVRKMFAMRACRSSVMIGRSLTIRQMERLVRHMGELDKPWNCPHGRPTMRHLCGLGAWSDAGWREGDGFDGRRAPRTDWAAYVREKEE
ncbi:DNA mismatch repair protein MutL [Xylariaceae sp. FL0662B]|nr:DNA mismatch repair protein MutL [Xylariaceae sp. FL0662B]